MALLTELPLQEAQRLGNAFGLEIASIEALSAGSVNSNFRFLTSDGARYFARIYEEQGLDGARGELRLVERLAAAGVPVARSLKTSDGELVVEIAGKPFAIYEWLDGEILCLGRVTPAACERVGAALARVHLCSAEAGSISEGRFRPADLRARLERIEGRDRRRFESAIALIGEKLAHYEARRSAHIPRGVIHSDLFRDNVLWSGSEIAALLDFESACWGSFAYDVMVTILAWCYRAEFDLDCVQALLRGYSGVRRMTSDEIAALCVEGAIGCLRFATTRITDFSLRVPEGTPPLRDYRRFLARLDALEAGVLDRCFAMLDS